MLIGHKSKRINKVNIVINKFDLSLPLRNTKIKIKDIVINTKERNASEDSRVFLSSTIASIGNPLACNV